MTLSRREFVVGTTAGAFLVADWLSAAPEETKYKDAFRAIDTMVERYMREMNSPGMTLAIADRNETIRVATYGFGSIDRKEPVRPEQLFQIGSITKSFVALALLQARDEGKIDLHAPVTKYLPWLRIEPRDGITAHHLLTHSSGLISWGSPFLSDPAAHHQSGFTPGSHFFYCNFGYTILGYLLEAVDGRTYPDSVRARIFKPLGMNASEAVIAPALRARTVENYTPFRDDVPFTRFGRLAHAPQFVLGDADGSISSTAADMALYIRMLANHGKPLLREETFSDFVKRHIKLDPSADPAYGYGLFIDKLDDHEIARHTGGMVSFMSAMHVDLEDGIGAFASVNAQQGYRPNPVSIFAVRAIRAVNAKKPLPEIPSQDPATKISFAKDLAGVYTSPEGEKIEFVAENDNLFLVYGGKRFPVDTNMYVEHPDFELFAFQFEREQKEGARAKSVGHGSRWWMAEGYSGPKSFNAPDAWRAYAGHYRNDDPWLGSIRINIRQGKLWMNGTTPLREVGATTFRLADPDFNPDWIQFLDVVGGKSRHVKMSGVDFWRVETR